MFSEIINKICGKACEKEIEINPKLFFLLTLQQNAQNFVSF